jgi:putative multiple sugar transport system permease protein
MLAFRGLTNVILRGQFISPLPPDFTRYFASYLTGGTEAASKMTFSISIGVVICLVVLAAAIYGRINKIRKNYETNSIAATTVRLAVICAVIMGVFYCFGKDRGVPVLLILLCAVVLTYFYFTSKTVPGRYLYAMGGNEKAAKLSGVNTNGMMFFAYANMGFLAAVAALVCMARYNMANPTLGSNFELDAIGACFIGGASAYGGVGTVGGTLIGTILMGVLNNGMSILGVDQNWQQAVKGSVLLAAVIFDILSKKRKNAA